MKRLIKCSSAFMLLFAAFQSAAADSYADARAELVTAYQSGDYEAMVLAAEKSLLARPEYPSALFNLALAYALGGEGESSLHTLNALLVKGVDFGANEMDEFAALRELPGWGDYVRGVEAIYQPSGVSEVALQLDDGTLWFAQVLGDLIVVDSYIYATDSLTGALYRFDTSAGEFDVLIEPGELGSPQGLVSDETGEFLYIADYIGGLFQLRLADKSLGKVSVPVSVSDYGIDGLYRYGSELIVIQNGIRPHRVAAFRLGSDGLSVTGQRNLAANVEVFDEPTLGVVHGDDFYFVANSHWNRFDRENQLPDGLSGPTVLKLSLLQE